MDLGFIKGELYSLAEADEFATYKAVRRLILTTGIMQPYSRSRNT
jgi:hypothetical protein